MRILICMEDEKYADELVERIKSFPCPEEIDFESYTETPFVTKRISVQEYDMAFIEPVINGKNGCELARMLKEEQPQCILFLVCEDYRYMHESFRCHAFQLLIKAQPKLLETEFMRAIKLHNKTHFKLEYTLDSGQKIQLLPSEVFYIETFDDKTVVVTAKERLNGTCENLKAKKAALLDYNFVQMHPNFFVNVEHLDLLRVGETKLTNGDYIPTSVLYLNEIDAAIQKYVNM